MLDVRPLRADELPAAHALEASAYPPAEAASLARLEDRQHRFPEGFVGVFEDGVLRAFASAVRTSVEDLGREEIKETGGHDERGRDLAVLSVATALGHRGRGFAGLLLEALGALAGRLGVRRLRLLCKTHLVPFYQRRGWVHVGRSSSTHGGASWHEMERNV
jgi:GNAT superfamily N-acetyltransferase